MSRHFSVQRGSTRVVFGAGASEGLLDEVRALALDRVLTVCTPRREGDAAAIASRLGPRNAGVLPVAREHVPVETVTEARGEAERRQADAVLAFGGGSAIGLAKAVALSGRARALAIPTTYCGSEMTPTYGTTDAGQKKTGRDERVRPVLVLYDPTLTLALPRAATVSSLWNAMAHAVEGLWSAASDRATRLGSEEALRLTSSSALSLATRPDDLEAREDALEGAYLAGLSFAVVGAGLHHKLCHVLGGMFALPHAATHAVLLPHVVRLVRDQLSDAAGASSSGLSDAARSEAMSAIARALGAVDPVEAIDRLARATDAPQSLERLGMPRDGVDRAVDALLQSNLAKAGPPPRPLVVALLTRAWSGPAPRSHAPPLRAPGTVGAQPGLGSVHESEALEGALPRRQNAPRRAPYGLYPELLSGTPFTVRNTDNSRVWMYRIRPSFSHSVLSPLASPRFAAPLQGACPNRTRWKPLPIPQAPASVDLIDGLITLGGAGEPTAGPGYAVHLYAANADMTDRCFSDADGDLLLVPQTGTLDCRTELGWLRAAPGSILLIPRGLKFAIGLPDGGARGFVLEVYGRRFRLPERGLIGSNGLADPRHFLAPTASFENRLAAGGFEIVTKLGGALYAGVEEHSPFDVVAWHGNHVPFTYDLSLFSAMGSVTFDHPDPSILTVLTTPLDDHGRAIADFVLFPPRWEVIEHSFRPPFMHRNAASEINMVLRTPSPDSGYEAGCIFVSPLLTSHGVSTSTYDAVLGMPDDLVERPTRISNESLWAMFESSLPFRSTAWARETPLVDADFLRLFQGMRQRFDPSRR